MPAAMLPAALAVLGAFALPDAERVRIEGEELVIPDTPAALSSFFGDEEHLSICSFNIQFLGNSTRRDCPALGAILNGFDIVVVQELVSPPYAGEFPDQSPFRPDPQAAEFFDVMVALGYEYVLSEEDTGTGDTIHRNGSATEWWVAFYQPDRVQVATDLPGGFLADDRSNHDDFERVPFAFPFRSFDHSVDFVLVSVHLQPGSSRANTSRRRHELETIGSWIDEHNGEEQDFIIIGDMNIEDDEELEEATPEGFVSLNDEVEPTNTNVRSPKPYDHAMIDADSTVEVDTAFDFKVVNLVDTMSDLWHRSDRYPGHHPVVIRLRLQEVDDD
jgi:endonuclease/exonuclease/phosphatase family metal-dependent hydrolase